MARIRTIKPEFFTSEDIVALSPLARLLFIALWCEADKEGRLAWKPLTFKMRYLPADDASIKDLCAELVNQGVVRLYGDGLAWIPGFSKHQHVNPRESASDLPAPDGVGDAGPRKVGKNTREAVFERDGHKCVRCGSEEYLQADHILPQSCGGPHIMENLRTLCRSCNAGRPVSGDGLVKDLKKDGHTIESLRAKFGIDASILDQHAQVGREGKGRESKGREGDGDAKRRTRLPADFYPDEAGIAAIAATGLSLAVELEKFKNHHNGKGSVMLDWQAAWRTWAGNALTFAPQKSRQSSQAKTINDLTGGLASAKDYPNALALT